MQTEKVKRSILGGILIATLFAFSEPCTATRIKDIASIQGARSNQLIGYGLVVGLDGTGDKDLDYTTQAISNMLTRFGLTINPNDIKSKNTAAVMVTADLPPFARAGTRIDCVISSLGDAKSLQGGTLLLTPLQGPNQEVYAMAQGPISIGGFNIGGSGLGGETLQKNHVNVGRIPGGAIVEREVPIFLTDGNQVHIVLRNPDFVTARRVAEAINKRRQGFAQAVDGAVVTVMLPEEVKKSTRLIDFLAEIESIPVVPDTVARVVVNERTGTIVAGADVRISKVAISHGNLHLAVKSTPVISQPGPVSVGGDTVVVAPPLPNVQVGGQTVVAEDQRADFGEEDGRLMVLQEGASIEDVASSLNALGVKPRDIISIFQALKAAGALQAELVLM